MSSGGREGSHSAALTTTTTLTRRVVLLNDCCVRHLLTLLTPLELCNASFVSKSWREAAENDVLWAIHCEKLWEGKLHVDRRPDLSRKFAYFNSIAHSKRSFITRKELLSFTFSFRFRSEAGEEWTARDPWWKGKTARTVRFDKDGQLKMVVPASSSSKPSTSTSTTSEGDDLPRNVLLRWKLGFWKYGVATGPVPFPAHGQRKARASEEAQRQQQMTLCFRQRSQALLQVREQDVNVSRLRIAAAAAVSASTSSSAAAAPAPAPAAPAAAPLPRQQETSRRRSARIALIGPAAGSPWDSVEADEEHRGDCVQVTVQGNPAPTYVVRRLPHNWGVVLESCWALYTSFPMPSRGECPELEDDGPLLTLSTEEQEDDISRYNWSVQFAGGGGD